MVANSLDYFKTEIEEGFEELKKKDMKEVIKKIEESVTQKDLKQNTDIQNLRDRNINREMGKHVQVDITGIERLKAIPEEHGQYNREKIVKFLYSLLDWEENDTEKN